MRTRDEAKTQAIRLEAMALIVKEGFDGLSMHKLARAVGVSVATIYIYYKDREDLIVSLCREEMERMAAAMLDGFDPALPFADGLRVQWRNRARFFLDHPVEAQFMERMRHSPYHDKVMKFLGKEFTDAMWSFVRNAVRRKECVKLPIEVYWSLAYAPLYQLLKFHQDGARFPGGEPFTLTDAAMNSALKLVLKALKP